MIPAQKKPLKQPSFFEGVVGSIIPLAAAVVVSAITGMLIYMFWFGTEWLTNWLFH